MWFDCCVADRDTTTSGETGVGPSDLSLFDLALAQRQMFLRLVESLRFEAGPFWLVVGPRRTRARTRVRATSIALEGEFPLGAEGRPQVWDDRQLRFVGSSVVSVAPSGTLEWVFDLGAS